MTKCKYQMAKMLVGDEFHSRWNHLWPLVAAYMFLIFGLSAIPDHGRSSPGFLSWISPNLQNLLHIPEFGVLAFLWMKIFCRRGTSLPKAGLWAILISVSYGFLDEFHQLFVPGRYASAGDFLFDTTGVLLGIAAFSLISRVSREARKG
ncbi:MAG: VanZ family protein [Pseudomonadota bacterium]